MDSKKAALDRLALALAIFKDYVAIQNGAFLFDSNRLADGLMRDLLSLICDWGALTDINREISNHPAIDLLSEDGTIGVQVTSTNDIGKVKDTIKKFLSLPNPPQILYIVMICGRQESYSEKSIAKSLGTSTLKFEAKKHILDLGDVHKAASARDVKYIVKAVERLEAELGERSLKLLDRFKKPADRVLRVLTSHDLRPSSIVQALKVSSTTPLSALTTSHELQAYLTTEVCDAIAKEFNVPAKWITGHSDSIGNCFGPSPWRELSMVKNLLSDILNRYNGATFYIVLPDDIIDPFKYATEEHQHVVLGADNNVPVLVYYKAKGEYGDVYVNLGVQSWNILHHMKATIFLGTALRDLSFAGLGNFQVFWQLWPKELILATCSDKLLAEIILDNPGSRLNETDAMIYERGQWKFVGHEDFAHEFNSEFSPSIRDLIRITQNVRHYENLHASITAELQTKKNIPAPASGTGRIYGGTACDIAEQCGTSVFVGNEDGEVNELLVADARELIESQISYEGDEFPSKVIFIDVCPPKA